MNFRDIGQFEEAARAALQQYEMSGQWEIFLLHRSENVTFLISEKESERRAVMRVARPGYHTAEELESEIRWVEKLWEEQVVPVARPIKNRQNCGVTFVTISENGEPDKKKFACLMFEYLSGIAPNPKKDFCALADFREIGRLAAKLHEQVIHWPAAETLRRPHWDYEQMLGENALFGDWRKCRDLDEDDFRVVSETCKQIQTRLRSYGKRRETYGLIHSDLRAANLLKNQDQIQVIDFDDSGFGWFLYDAAAAVSFVEEDERVGEWLKEWVQGYQTIRNLSVQDKKMIPVFVMARRIQLMAWITSHDDSDPVSVYYQGFAEKTIDMAKIFLEKGLSH